MKGTNGHGNGHHQRFSDVRTENRSPEEIQREIEVTRAQMGRNINQLQRQLSPGYLMDRAVDYFRGESGELENKVIETARNNPLAVAMIGVGAALLFKPPGRRQRIEPYYYQRHTLLRERDQQLGLSPGVGSEGGEEGELMGGAKQRLEGAGEEAKQRLEGAGEEVRHRLDEVKHRFGDAKENAKHRFDDAKENAKHRFEGIKESADQWAHRAKESSQRAQTRVKEEWEAHPLLIGAVAFAVGTLVSAALPVTRRENEMLGGYKDELVDNLKAKGREGMEKLGKVAEAAKERAKEELDNQGLTSGGSPSGGSFVSSGEVNTGNVQEGKVSGPMVEEGNVIEGSPLPMTDRKPGL